MPLDYAPGKVVEEFDAKKEGKRIHVVLRYPSMSDLDGALGYINAVMKETEFLRHNRELSREEEKEWLEGTIKGMKDNNKVAIFVEVNGRIVGSGTVEKSFGASAHVGTLGISLLDRYTGLGIGTRYMKTLMEKAKDMGVEVVKLSHYESNDRARHVYEKLGFKPVGTMPRARKDKDGSYQGETIMYRMLE